MLVSGIQQFTLLDYPGKVAAIVFVPGCTFRCGFCHNSEFVLPEKIQKLAPHFITPQAVLNFLRKRSGKLEGVVISGGEPTVMPDLPEFIRNVKRLGFLVKLDTCGRHPQMVKDLVQEKLVDYVAMDVKTSPAHYRKLVGPGANVADLRKSIRFLMKDTVEYEFRSTLIKEVHPPAVLREMGEWVAGAKVWYLQRFRNGETLDPTFANYRAFTDKELKKIKQSLGKYVKRVVIRS